MDGTKIKASNNKKQNFSKRKLAERIKAIEGKINKYLDAIGSDEDDENLNARDTQKILEELEKRKEKYENTLRRLQESGDNEVSMVDPDARMMGTNLNGIDICHNVQSVVDAKHHFIVGLNVTNNPTDHGQLSVMANIAKETLGVEEITVTADKGYYNGPDLAACKENKIITIVSRQEASNRAPDPRFNADKFSYDADKDTFTCPAGHVLSLKNKSKERRKYKNQKACKGCEFRELCTKGKVREITRSCYAEIYEETDKRTRENMHIYRLRQQLVEHPFGTIKRTMNGAYFLLRTQRKVRGEVALLFFGYNLKRLINIMGFDATMERLRVLSLRDFFALRMFQHQKASFAA